MLKTLDKLSHYKQAKAYKKIWKSYHLDKSFLPTCFCDVFIFCQIEEPPEKLIIKTEI